MLKTVEEALVAILEHVTPLAPQPVPLSEALGLTLAEAVVSDADSPPFDKALMDGYAVRSVDVQGGKAVLRVIEEVTAGHMPFKPLGLDEATRIMTGAPLPEECDCVVRIEHARGGDSGKTVTLETTDTQPGTNILLQGAVMRAGDAVLPAGRTLRPQELGALAELGRHRVMVRRRPVVAVLATGDELVPVDQTPGPGQIRNSNETMLCAQIRAAGAEPLPLGIARDERSHLAERIRAGLKADVLVLSGGVSAGKLDLVPSELAAAGVREVFHKVDVKPGKPVWFGVHEAAEDGRTLVFGLPGNPVGSMVCFELFTRTALRALMGIEPAEPTCLSARLAIEHVHRGDRPTYHPSRLAWTADGPRVTPVPWQGSSDLRATVDACAMTIFPAGDQTYPAGTPVNVIPW
jgi:molybdopterin molybdotransferase